MNLVLFGNGKFASLAWYCITHDSAHRVVAFTVDAPFLKEDRLHGLPVVDFTQVQERFAPTEHEMLVHLGQTDMGALRISRVAAARAKGYRLASYVSSRALTWPDLRIGENCSIYDGVIVEPFVSIGENAILRNGVHLCHHARVGDHCFLAAGACLGGGAILEPRCFVGLNATIRDGIRVAEGCLIAAGAVVASDTEPDGLYLGVPARRAPKPASAFSVI